MKLFEVVFRRKDRESTAYYVASHINQVIQELAADLTDQATEVLKIEERVPILKILQ